MNQLFFGALKYAYEFGPGRVISSIKAFQIQSESVEENIGLIATVGLAVLVALIFVWILTK